MSGDNWRDNSSNQSPHLFFHLLDLCNDCILRLKNQICPIFKCLMSISIMYPWYLDLYPLHLIRIFVFTKCLNMNVNIHLNVRSISHWTRQTALWATQVQLIQKVLGPSNCPLLCDSKLWGSTRLEGCIGIFTKLLTVWKIYILILILKVIKTSIYV